MHHHNIYNKVEEVRKLPPTPFLTQKQSLRYMKKMKLYEADDKMIELIRDNYSVLQVPSASVLVLATKQLARFAESKV